MTINTGQTAEGLAYIAAQTERARAANKGQQTRTQVIFGQKPKTPTIRGTDGKAIKQNRDGTYTPSFVSTRRGEVGKTRTESFGATRHTAQQAYDAVEVFRIGFNKVAGCRPHSHYYRIERLADGTYHARCRVIRCEPTKATRPPKPPLTMEQLRRREELPRNIFFSAVFLGILLVCALPMLTGGGY